MQELAGMPEPAPLRRVESAGRCLVTAGGRVLFCYDRYAGAMPVGREVRGVV